MQSLKKLWQDIAHVRIRVRDQDVAIARRKFSSAVRATGERDSVWNELVNFTHHRLLDLAHFISKMLARNSSDKLLLGVL
jgi:hypothetical protein